ncbi:MAG: SIR2 family NAD-dependent protein deacylase [Thermosulfidibacteraceae bacterium]|jgi:NAD-dependent deacetylase
MELLDLVKKIEESKNIVVLTGAGISHESGIPTFRGKDGLWEKYKPEELATPWAFEKNPKLVWEWYNYRREIIAKAKPNECHYLIAELEKEKDLTLITQNIDGLHELAGSRDIIELHGNIWRVKCTKCSYKEINRDVPLKEIPPKCPKCVGLLRPDVVWFGEPLPTEELNDAMELSAKCDLFIVIGTSLVVQPAGSLPFIALENRAFVVEVNPEETILSQRAHLFFKMKAVEFARRFKEVWKELC